MFSFEHSSRFIVPTPPQTALLSYGMLDLLRNHHDLDLLSERDPY